MGHVQLANAPPRENARSRERAAFGGGANRSESPTPHLQKLLVADLWDVRPICLPSEEARGERPEGSATNVLRLLLEVSGIYSRLRTM